MGWRILALLFFLAGIAVLPVWPYSQSVPFFAPLFCWFVAVLTLVVSFISRVGGPIWKGRGHG